MIVSWNNEEDEEICPFWWSKNKSEKEAEEDDDAEEPAPPFRIINQESEISIELVSIDEGETKEPSRKETKWK